MGNDTLPAPNLALESLDVMVGTWDLQGHESGPEGEIHGRVLGAHDPGQVGQDSFTREDAE